MFYSYSLDIRTRVEMIFCEPNKEDNFAGDPFEVSDVDTMFDYLSNVKEEIIFKNKIGRIRDIQVHPINGKIYFLAGNNLWLMEKS